MRQPIRLRVRDGAESTLRSISLLPSLIFLVGWVLGNEIAGMQ